MRMYVCIYIYNVHSFTGRFYRRDDLAEGRPPLRTLLLLLLVSVLLLVLLVSLAYHVLLSHLVFARLAF